MVRDAEDRKRRRRVRRRLERQRGLDEVAFERRAEAVAAGLQEQTEERRGGLAGEPAAVLVPQIERDRTVSQLLPFERVDDVRW